MRATSCQWVFSSGVFVTITRGYRSIILAIAGLIFIGVGEPSNGRTKAVPLASSEKSLMAATTSTVHHLDKTDETDKPCPKDKDNRNSDLCAQWKAADAAADSANASWSQFYLGIGGLAVGFFTLVAAGAAAVYSKLAASQTQRHADIAENSADNIERPYLFPAVRPTEAVPETGHPMRFSIIFQNYGRTPAKIVRIGARGFNLGVVNRDANLEEMKRSAAEVKFPGIEAVISPGGQTIERESVIIAAPRGENDQHPPPQETAAFVISNYEYADFSGKTWHGQAVFEYSGFRGYFSLLEHGESLVE